MATKYDVKITKKGFFSLFGHNVHAPTTLQDLSEAQLQILDLHGWTYEIINIEEDNPTTGNTGRHIKTFIVDNMSQMGDVLNPQEGDRLYIKPPINQEYIYVDNNWVLLVPQSSNTPVVADITARNALTPSTGMTVFVTDASADPNVESGSAFYIWNGTSWQLVGGNAGGSGGGSVVVADITARNALTPTLGMSVFVSDASGDPSVSSGFAQYVWDGTNWVKLLQQNASSGSGDMNKSVYDQNDDGKVDSAEVADEVAWSGVVGRPTSAVSAIDNAVAVSHTHSNLSTLNKISEAGGLPRWNGGEWPGGGSVSTQDKIICSFIAAENISAFSVIALDANGKAVKANQSTLAHAGFVVGISINQTTVATGGTVDVVTFGIFENPSASFTGRVFYAGSNGALTTTKPTTGFSQVVARFISSTKLFVRIEPAIEY